MLPTTHVHYTHIFQIHGYMLCACPDELAAVGYTAPVPVSPSPHYDNMCITLQQKQSYDIDFSVCMYMCVCVCNVCLIVCVISDNYVCVMGVRFRFVICVWYVCLHVHVCT